MTINQLKKKLEAGDIYKFGIDGDELWEMHGGFVLKFDKESKKWFVCFNRWFPCPLAIDLYLVLTIDLKLKILIMSETFKIARDVTGTAKIEWQEGDYNVNPEGPLEKINILPIVPGRC